MTLCYFVQSHRDPEQIERLIRTLRAGSPSTQVLLQHNFTNCPLDEAKLAALPGVHLLHPLQPQVRANFSCQVQPYLEAIAYLEREGIAYDWLVSLTAQCYPVKPPAEIEAFHESASCDAFIRYWDVDAGDSPWSRRKPHARYWHRYWRLPAKAEPLLRFVRPLTKLLPIHFYLDYGPLVGARRLITPFGKGFRCYGGWAWFSLRRHVALYLRDYLAGHPSLEGHYRKTVTPEESIVQTVLVNSGLFSLVNDDLRYIDYSQAKKGSPRTLTASDMKMLAEGSFLFARKFDLGVDREVLDRIDSELLGMGPLAAAAV